MSDKRFTPVRGVEDKIAGHVMGFHDGFVYFATDTGKIYMDYTDENGKRKTPSKATGLPVKGNKKRAEAMLQKARIENRF